MKTRIKKIGHALILALTLIFPTLAGAQDGPPPQPQSGFKGMIRTGVGYISTTDQLNASGDNRMVDNLSDNADRFNRVIPLILFDFRYVFEGRGTEVYVKTPFGDNGPPGLAVGTVQPLAGLGKMDINLWANPFGEVWEDPYLVGVAREETSTLLYGINVDIDDLWTSDWLLKYSYGRADVDNDGIGDRFGLLARDGDQHELGVGYKMSAPLGVMVVPVAVYTRTTLDGEAESFDGYGVKVSLHKFTTSYALNVFLNLSYREYGESHPIYHRTREDLGVGGFAMLTFPNLFGMEGILWDLIGGYSYRSSNIDFLDAESFIGGVSVGYEF